MSRIAPLNDDKSFSSISFTNEGPIVAGQQIELTYDREIRNDFNLSAGDRVIADTRKRSFTFYLPSTPSDGDNIRIIDGYGTFKKNPVYIDGSGERVDGKFERYTVSKGLVVDVVFSSGSGWSVTVAYSGSTEESSEVLISNIKDIYSSQFDKAERMVARYDEDAHGDYIISGYRIKFLQDEGDFHRMRLSGGKAHVNGRECIREASSKFKIERALNYDSVDNEPHSFKGDGWYELRWYPIKQINEITGVKQISINVTHGDYSGASDLLEPNPVVSIMEVTQSGTTYVEGDDYIQDGDYIDWSPSGDEPSPGSTYSVTYKYQDDISSSISDDRKSIQVTGLASDSIFYVTYDFYIDRIDRVILTKENNLVVLQGKPDAISPVTPSAQSGLPLATVTLRYGRDPDISYDYFKLMGAEEMQLLEGRMSNSEYNIAKLTLKDDSSAKDPTLTKLNTFVDPFYDDDLRDDGMENNASIIDTNLELPVEWANQTIKDGERIYLDYNENDFITQTAESTSHKVEPYMWAEVPPANISISPKTHKWTARETFETLIQNVRLHNRSKRVMIEHAQKIGDTEEDLVWYEPWNQWFNKNALVNGKWTGVRVFENYLKRKAETLNESYEVSNTTIPNIDIRITGNGFNGGEDVSITFDQLEVGPATADSDGKIDYTFTIPDGQDSGTKQIEAIGVSSGAVGESTFVGTPVGSFNREIRFRRVDPIAQTFIPTSDATISSFELIYTSRPSTWSTVKLCKTTAGIPDDNKVVAWSTKDADEIVVNGWTSFSFEPYQVTRNDEYAFIIECLDKDVKVKSAKLGQWDRTDNKWLVSQPFSMGTLLDSSTSTTWTPVQDEDLTFKIKSAKFSLTKTTELNTVSVTDATDFMVLANTEVPEGCISYFVITLLDRSDNNQFTCPAFTPIAFNKYTGDIKIEAFLESTNEKVSPSIDGDIQISVGELTTEATYTSRSFTVDGSTIKSYVMLLEPSGTSVKMRYMNDGLVLSDGGSSNLWTQSGSDPDAYYYTGDALENRKPESVYFDEVEATEIENPSDLAEGEWAYGDIDSIGSDALYVKLASSVKDPDSESDKYVTAKHFLELPRQSGEATPIGSDFYEVPFKVEGLDITRTAIRLILSTSSSINRPVAKNLRAIVST